MANYMTSVFKLINNCNTQVSNNNDYNIARVILSHVDDLESLSLETLSQQANISQASVSRFIKKMGFKSYQDFRESFQKAILEIKLNRKLANALQYPQASKLNLSKQIYDEALINLTQTRDNIDLLQLEQVIELINQASTVTFYGDDHALSIFYTFQLDLLANGIPTYLFKINEVQDVHMQFLKSNSLIIFFNVFNGFFSSEQKENLKLAKKNGAKLVVFTQDELGFDLFDLEIYYGKKNNMNTGYYSLLYLSRLLSEFYYKYE